MRGVRRAEHLLLLLLLPLLLLLRPPPGIGADGSVAPGTADTAGRCPRNRHADTEVEE